MITLWVLLRIMENEKTVGIDVRYLESCPCGWSRHKNLGIE
jgi:hypothetical protein